MSDSAYSSDDLEGFPEKPAAAELPLPNPVVTAMNFINSSATSSRLFFAATSDSAALLAALVSSGFASLGVNLMFSPAAQLHFRRKICP